jgi:molybdate transport system regulatory protein
MLSKGKRKPSGKIWIEYEGKPLIGKGGAEILEEIGRTESISDAAKNLGMSYRYVWNYLGKINRNTGVAIVETFRGGKSGGGGTKLTELGKSLLHEYSYLENRLSEVISTKNSPEVRRLKISARNRLKGKVVALEKNGLMAKVRVEITLPVFVTSIISKEAAEDLTLKVGDQVEAIVKATEVLIAK